MYTKKNTIRIDLEKFTNLFKINYVCKEPYIDLETYVQLNKTVSSQAL